MDALCLYRCRDGVAISFCICAWMSGYARGCKTRLTWEARLTDLAPPPVEIIAPEADPVTRLVLDGTPVARVENGGLLMLLVNERVEQSKDDVLEYPSSDWDESGLARGRVRCLANTKHREQGDRWRRSGPFHRQQRNGLKGSIAGEKVMVA